MESTTVKLYSLNYGNVRTYLAASLFIVGNILFPQFFHLIPQGGITWLPIYFFTLIGAYKYGWKVGLLTAVLSPIINSSLFGMPMPVVLPAILLKSVLLAIAAGWAAQRFGRISIPVLVGGTYLSSCRDIGRVDVYGKFLQCHSGFPHWNSRNVPASIRRLFIH